MDSAATRLVLFGALIICCVIQASGGADVEGFEIKVGELNILYLEDQGTVTTNFVYTSTLTSPQLTGAMDSGETFTGTVNTGDKTASASIPASQLIHGHGTFLVIWTLVDSGASMTIKQVVFFEEPIEGFKMVCEKTHVLINEEFNCTLTFTKGTNIEIEYFFDENTTCLEEYNGTLRTAVRNYTYTSAAEYNITTVVANTISRTSTSNIVTAQHPVEGFSLTTATGPVQTTETVTFTLTLTSDAKLPMGNIYLELNYGNGDKENLTLNDKITDMQGSGYKPTKTYTTQGNYTVEACVRSEISSQCFDPFEVYIWDNVVACLNADDVTAAVNQVININFINPPTSGFQYYIDYGDGTSVNNTADVLYSAYVAFSLTKSFTSPGIYKVVSAAWNPFYVSVCEIQVIVQYPIVEADITLTPVTDAIPVPDGQITMTMTLTVNHPTATNVTCSFDNGDSKEDNVTTEIKFGAPILKEYNYTAPGQKDINFTCVNVISSSVKTATIQVHSFTLNDFKILHLDVAPMNMSETTDELGFPTPKSDSSVVEFVTYLLGCSKFPPGVSFVYTFGDGGTHTESQAPKSVIHEYKNRGTYSITVDLAYNGTTHQITSSITLGLVTLTSSQEKGEVGVTQFTLTMDGLGAGGTYELSVEPDATPQTFPSGSATTKTHQYNKWGVYLPYVIAKNSSFTEIVYLNPSIKVDFMISDELQVVLSNSTIDLPPGIILVNVSLKNSAKYFPNVNCKFDMGDDIDRNVHNVTDNITDTNSLSFNYTYSTLGGHEIKTNCCNFIDCFENQTFSTTLNPCFEVAPMFERLNSHPSTPLFIYTSTPFSISNRMGVKCWYLMPGYRWTLQRVIVYDETGKTETEDFTYDESKVFSSNATFTIQKGGLQPDLYKLCLNVTLTDTWAYECTFLKCRIPKPRAMITGGGGKKLARNSAQQISAYEESYNCEEGLGEQGRIGLNYTWFCYKYSNVTLDTLTDIFNTGGGFATFANSSYNANNECGDLVSTTSNPGKIHLNTSTFDYNGYIVIVAIDLLHADRAYYTQNIEVIPGDPPAISITCLQNCREKVSTNEKLSVASSCEDCSSEEKQTATYEWTIYQYDKAQEKYITPSTTIQSDTGTNARILVINANSLEAGKQYKLIEYVTVSGRSSRGEATYTFVTSYAPCCGTCSISPTVGNATTTKFEVTCANWFDEGSNLERDPSADGNEPLFYTYIARKPQWVNNKEEVQETILTSSSENSVSNIPFQVGDEHFNYTIKILIKICDRLGSCNETEVEAQVKPDTSFLPANPNDTAALDEFLDSYNSTILQLQASGNKMAVARYMTAAASMLEMAVEGMDDPNSPVVSAVREKNNEIILTLASMVSNDSKDALSVGDAGTIMANINQCFQNPLLSDDQTANTASQSINDICIQMLQTTTKNPYPVDHMPALAQITEDVVETVENLLDSFLPKEIEDLTKEITEESVYDEMYQYNSTVDLTEEQLAARRAEAKKEYERRMEARRIQQQKSQDAPGMVDNLVNAVRNLQGIRGSFLDSGEPATIINRTNLMISVEKNTVESFTNRSEIDRDSVKLNFGNTSLQPVDDIQLQVAVFNKVPYFYGKDASKLTSGSVMVSTEVNGVPTLIQNDMKITNEGTVHMQTQTPKYFPDDPDQMWHYVFYMPDENDVIFVYYKPLGFDIYSSGYETLARLICYVRDIDYASVATHDCSSTFEVRDYEDPIGFKIYFPPRCIKEGEAYMGCKLDSVKPVPMPSAKYRRRRRSITNTSAVYEDKDANFSLIIATTGCRTWNANSKGWETNGCTVLSWSTINDTICRCPDPVGNMFGTTFFVPPNKIDFNAVWSKFDPSNAAVYGTIIGLFVVYALVCIWARREDKKDFDRWATHFLVDSDSNDVYFYLISVHTGLRRGAGTKSNVNFVLAGDEMDSGVRILSDGIKQGFESSSVRKFFMGTPEKLGELTYLRIWHDNSGAGDNKGWYLHKVVIDDPQTSQRYVFMCDKWLAAEYDDGAIERLLPVCGTDNLVSFDKLFSQHARFNLTENHLWLSMIMRPEQSSFTRVQRLSCIMALLFLTMIANAMFFKSQDENVQPDGVQIGSLRFSLTTIYISLIGILITTPPVLLMTYIFRKAKIKIPKKTTATKKYEKEVREIFQTRAVMNQSEYFSDMEFYSLNHLPLPFWTIYIAWVVVVLAVLTSAFFLILYSMEWGKPKSEEWLSTFVFSFVESLFFVDPVKVILIAVLFALLFKKPVDNQSPTVNMDKLKDAAKLFNAGSTRNYLSFRNDVLKSGDPPSNAALEKARLQRKMEMKAQEVFMELILYVIFAFIVYSISYINRDQRSFNMRENINNALFYSSKTQFGFDKIKYTVDYQTWLKETLFPLYFPEKHFDNSPLDTRDKQFFYDLANMRIGPARLRQVRMNRGACNYADVTPDRDCVPNYDDFGEETKDYCIGWNPYNTSCANNPSLFTKDAWVYRKASDIWGIPIAGDYDVYGGGGYILKLDIGLGNSIAIANELNRYKWINRETRAVFMEFTLYNANINLFAYAVFLAEFTDTGGIVTWVDIRTFRPYQHTGGLGTFAMICYFVYLIVLIVGIVKTIKKLKNQGCKFFADIWNVVDTLSILLSFVGIVMWTLRYLYASESMERYRADIKAFINFQHVVVWDYFFTVIIGILVFIATIRILRILGYNKRMTQLAAVIANASADLSGFAVVFGIVFFAYVSLGYLLFGVHIKGYKNLFSTTGSLTNALIGKNSLDSMIRAVPSFSQLYYFTYVFFVILTLMTMFAVILNQSISEVRADLQKVPQAYGILDILTSSIKDVLGIAFKFKGKDVTEQNTAKRHTSEYIPAAGKRVPDLDAPNILRIVRETFGDKWEDEEGQDSEEIARRKQAEKQLLILDSYLHPKPGSKDNFRSKSSLFNRSMDGESDRAGTPGDIRLTVDTPAVDQDKLYSAYL